MDFTNVEVKMLYTAMLDFRNNAEIYQSRLKISDHGYNTFIEHVKHCNALIRKLKHYMKDNGIKST
jgi:hypothetical protein